MLGAIIGDIVGSPYEFDENNIKTTQFPLVNKKSVYTDDSIMTCAVAKTCLESRKDPETFKYNIKKNLHQFGNEYRNPEGGYGSMFLMWLYTSIPDGDYSKLEPFGSYGNGAGMRVSPVAWYYDTLDEVLEFAKYSAEATHDHPEGVKGAQAVAAAIFLARTGIDKEHIKKYIEKNFKYDLNISLDKIRPTYRMDATCQGSIPQAIRAFLDGNTFEECIRLAISIGGDSDTIAAITGSIAEAYYHVPKSIRDEALKRLMPAASLAKTYYDFVMGCKNL